MWGVKGTRSGSSSATSGPLGVALAVTRRPTRQLSSAAAPGSALERGPVSCVLCGGARRRARVYLCTPFSPPRHPPSP